MQYKLIQQKDLNLVKFNEDINYLLKEGWKLEGDYRITQMETQPPFLIYTQLLTKEDDKPSMGFQVFCEAVEEPSKPKKKKKD